MSAQANARHSRFDLFSGALSVGAARLSLTEMVAIGAAVVAIGLVFSYYWNSLKPAHLQQQEAKERFDRQQEVLAGAALSQGSPQVSRAEQIQKTKESLERFKSDKLKPLDPGRSSIFDEINGLVKNNNVQLSSGIEMSTVGKALAGEKKKDIEDVLNVFPKRQIQFTVVGPYPNLRAFINSLERSGQFITVNTISFSAVDEAEGGRSRRRAAAGGSSVSLTIGVTAYYRA